MANTFRYLRGETNEVSMNVASATVIEVGDFILFKATGNYAIPPTSLASAGDAAANSEAAADAFVGISNSASAAGQTEKITVYTSGVFKLTLKTAADVAQFAQVEIYATTAGCEDQTIVVGSTSPIGHCVLAKATAGTDVEVAIKGTIPNPTINS